MKKIIIVTGMSGSGKSNAMKVLEDSGYYCVDNLPLNLVDSFLEEMSENNDGKEKIAISIDIRSLNFLESMPQLLEKERKERGTKIIFVEAKTDELIKRYKETRRKHPFALEGSIEQGIEKERELLKEIKKGATYIIDTSNIAAKEMKVKIENILSNKETAAVINLMSFGFKYGMPKDLDLLFDVRMLPNPYYDEKLKEKTGLEKEVSDYVYESESSKEYLEKTIDYLEHILPMYQKEGRKQLIIGIGCTGGKHRSVATTEALKEKLGNRYNIVSTHRDLGRE